VVELDSQSLKSTAQRAGLNVLLVFVGIVASLLLCELVLRFLNPFYARIKGNRIVLLANKRLQVKNTRIPRLDPVIAVTRNSLGFRGPDPPADFNDYLTIVTKCLRFRSPLSPLFSDLVCKWSERQQARLLRVQLEAELSHSFC
jgi:hypothetical protein